MRPFLTPVLAFAFLAINACTGPQPADIMEQRSPSVLLTSYAIANGMAEHGLVSRIVRRQASREEIAKLIAIDHNTWELMRQAALSPTERNFRMADDGILQILAYATPVPSVVEQERPRLGGRAK